MKKIVILLALVGLTTASFAQSDFKRFHFGLKVVPAINWASIDASNIQSNGTAFGFGYGAILEFGFTENYAFATGFDITTIGQKLTWTYPQATPAPGTGTYNVTTTFDMSLQYVQLPLLIKMKTNDIAGFRYFGQFGLNNGINITAKTNGSTFTSLNATPVLSESTSKEDIALFRESLIFGLGLEYNLAGSTNLLACVNFDSSFITTLSSKNSSLKDPTSGNSLENPAAYAKGVTLTVGILF